MIQCPAQLVDDFALRRLLALVGRIHRKGDLQAFDEVGRERCEGHLPLRHGVPFVRHRFIDMAIDDLAQLLPLVFRDALGEENDAAKGARFRRDSDLGPVKIVPDLNGDEAHEEKMMPSGGSIPGETALKARPRASTASRVTTK